MEKKFTQGEWSYKRESVAMFKVRSHEGVIVAETESVKHPFYPTPEGAEANAKLIAAAPEMLEVLTEMTNCIVGTDSNGFVIIHIPLELSQKIGNTLEKAIK